MQAPDTLRTARLELVRPVSTDADQIFSRYASDPEVTKYVGWPQHRSIEDTRAFLAFSEDEWSRWLAGPYLIRDREDGRLLGSTGLAFESLDAAATGYVLARDVWGRGYATEALRVIEDLAPALQVVRLYAFCHPDHAASRRVLEKCGFVQHESTHRMEFPNHAPGTLQLPLRFERPFTAAPAGRWPR